jgi:hypothetical protein
MSPAVLSSSPKAAIQPQRRRHARSTSQRLYAGLGSTAAQWIYAYESVEIEKESGAAFSFFSQASRLIAWAKTHMPPRLQQT